ncbi:MAG: bifunctional 4-hydroxy-2-oxoglutarate aldolase/2-dehydro-3-deoxy-phosphogluconate aldolase [Runella slithyformis]|nr:MAG: bifunctional 4-hydroxy-2-oxoglutarate aldolase/2-dehydro-3-deoxy-phosphogluconate aldolase [Runella slithyformis]TAG19312.1 MAG: bifunctional 4-hydroxy-2-oxoglutarate aldolase/2-dehydro-3-deoxy-phosphogluconate aldolase [Cytophagales bacterium]TAG38566.1 MAG: bifunctional 4-hydroxy-2-oxoglutarate aldolase/2-dehydro-3-deoxy-phosphogluconate aldolase [Cytophagia bacterium]TAF28316.1 MAG: bifunctional 4-hydroxy-2-oxoglutarate aldolase/2-dehydro-3-deoxy-phosphogluconate aldolase [Runella sli
MPRFSRLHVYQTLQAAPLMPLFYNPDPAVCQQVLKACYAAGVRMFEITNRGDFAHELFGNLVKMAAVEFPDMVLGAGTIVEPATAALYIQMGADFIVSPSFNADVARLCNLRKIAYMPGCATLTEISKAEEWGVEVVKLFPGDTLGPSFVKALKGPMPRTNVLVTGGVELTEASLSAWFGAGAMAVGIGSNLLTKEILKNRDWAALEQRVAEAMFIIAKVK